MPKSTYLNLELINDNTTLFKTFREYLIGSGLGNVSNAELIDLFAGKIFSNIKYNDVIQDTTDKYKFYLDVVDTNLIDNKIIYANFPNTILEDTTDSDVLISIDNGTTYKNLVNLEGNNVTVDEAFKRGSKIIFVYKLSENSWYPFATDKDFQLLAGNGWSPGENVRGNYLETQVNRALINDIIIALGSTGQIVRQIIDMTIPVTVSVTETKLVFDTLTTETNDDTILDVDVNGDLEMLDENTAGYRLSALVSVEGTQANPSITSIVRFNLYINGSATPSDTFDVVVGKDEIVNKSKEYTYVVPVGEAPDVAVIKAQLISGSADINSFTVTAQSLFTTGGETLTSAVTISATAPVIPTAGNLWWNSNDGTLYIYYDDGSSSQWVAATPVINSLIQETATLSSASWTGSSAPYSYALTVTDILSTDIAKVDLDLSSVLYADVEGKQTAWANVYRVVSSADTLTFYAHEAPTVDLPIQIEVVR